LSGIITRRKRVSKRRGKVCFQGGNLMEERNGQEKIFVFVSKGRKGHHLGEGRGRGITGKEANFIGKGQNEKARGRIVFYDRRKTTKKKKKEKMGGRAHDESLIRKGEKGKIDSEAGTPPFIK